MERGGGAVEDLVIKERFAGKRNDTGQDHSSREIEVGRR